MNVDSTNMRPQGWLAIADEVRRRYDDFDGFVVLHGTDTLSISGRFSGLIGDSRPALSCYLQKSAVLDDSYLQKSAVYGDSYLRKSALFD